MPKVLSFILSVLMPVCLVSCGGGSDQTDPVAVKECQAACARYVECDPRGDATHAMQLECVNACSDPAAAASLRIDTATLDCYRLDLECGGFNSCVNSIGVDGDGEDSNAVWCQSWCRRCSECLAKQPGFGEGMCMEGVNDLCLEKCAEKYENASGTCADEFNSFNPRQATCEELDDDNPFEKGC